MGEQSIKSLRGDSSLDVIGSFLGGRDHSTVLNGIDKINKLIDKDPNMKITIETIEKKLNV